MTIRFVKYWNGYSPDAIVHNLGSTEEARLVSLGYATTDLDGENDGVLVDAKLRIFPFSSVAIQDPSGQERYLTNNYGSLDLPAMEKFSNINQWTKTAADTANADVVASTDSLFGANSLEFTSTVSSAKSAYVSQNQRFNLNASGGFWLVWNCKYKQAAAAVGLTMYMSHSAEMASGVGRVGLVGALNTATFGYQSEWVANADWATLDGTPNFANDWLSWRFRVDSSTTEPHDFVLDAVLTGGIKPKILFTFDDGWATAYSNGFAEAQKREIPLSHYLIGSLLGKANYMTTTQAQEMAAAGDYLGVHDVGLWNTNTQSVVSASITALSGISDGRHGAWPEGNFNTGTACGATIAAAKAAGLKTIRAAGGATVWLPGITEWGAMPSYSLNSGTSLATAKAAIDTAIASGGVVTFYGHKIDTTADSMTFATADWIALLDYAYQKRLDGLIDIVTIKQLYDGSFGV